MSYVGQISASNLRCSIDIGTTFAEEAARLGSNPLEVLRQQRRERLTRMGVTRPIQTPTPASPVAAIAIDPVPEPLPEPGERDQGEGLIGPVIPESYFVSQRCRQAGVVTAEWIIAEVCLYYGFKRNDLLSPRRDIPYPTARQISYWLMRRLIRGISQANISRIMGGRNHATAFHGINHVDSDIAHGGPRAAPTLAIRAIVWRHALPLPEPAVHEHGMGASTHAALAAIQAGASEACEVALKLGISTQRAACALRNLRELGKIEIVVPVSTGNRRMKKPKCVVYRMAAP